MYGQNNMFWSIFLLLSLYTALSTFQCLGIAGDQWASLAHTAKTGNKNRLLKTLKCIKSVEQHKGQQWTAVASNIYAVCPFSVQNMSKWHTMPSKKEQKKYFNVLFAPWVLQMLTRTCRFSFVTFYICVSLIVCLYRALTDHQNKCTLRDKHIVEQYWIWVIST